MAEMGKAIMGMGEAGGEGRALAAAEAAISNPLLDEVSMKGAHGVLINITGGLDLTLFEVDQAANRIRDEVGPEANIIFGSTFDERLKGKMRVSVVATGIAAERAVRAERAKFMPVSPIARNPFERLGALAPKQPVAAQPAKSVEFPKVDPTGRHRAKNLKRTNGKPFGSAGPELTFSKRRRFIWPALATDLTPTH
jgi:cell division protein FtsZ